MFTWIALGGFAVLVAMVVNRRAVGRVYLALRGGLGSIGRTVGAINPIAQRQEELENAANEVEKARKGLEDVEALALSLNRQIQDDLKEKTKLENRIRSVLAKGDPNKTAENYALQLERLEVQLGENQKQYDGTRKIYDNYAITIKRGEAHLEERARAARQQNAQVEITGRVKAVLTSAKAFNASGFGSKLDLAEQAVLAQLDKNQAALNVAADLSTLAVSESADEDDERKERANKILQRFVALPAPQQG
jgi:phage shock protein A